MSAPGDRSRGKAAAQASRLRIARRRGVAVFAILLVGLFAGFAVAQGIGKPDVPSDAVAAVEDVPGDVRTVTDCNGGEVEDDPGVITEAEFDCALRQTAARAGLPRVPKPDNPQYEELREAAFGDLLDGAWIRGEAAEQGITASQREIDAQLDEIVGQNFRCPGGQDPFQCKEFRQFLERSRFSEDDVIARVELQILSTDLQNQLTGGSPEISADQIEEFYEDGEEQFTLSASRDIRLVLNRDRSKVEEAKSRLEEDDSEASWRQVARELSTDPASRANGGLRQGMTEGLLEEPLNGEVFSAARGEVVGPVRTPLGFYVFQVETVTAERTQALREVQGQIRSQLAQLAEQQAFADFVDDYGSRWQARTVCAGDFLFERCSNFEGTGHPVNVSPACYEENPKGGRPADCPAPVTQSSPALPGTVSVIAPQGQRMAQRPRPEALEELPAPGLPGAGGGSIP